MNDLAEEVNLHAVVKLDNYLPNNRMSYPQKLLQVSVSYIGG